MRLRFCTTNRGKIEEAQARLRPLGIQVEGVVAHAVEIQADDLEAVARHKAASLLDQVPAPFFCEDAGLFIDALKGFPGVYSQFVHSTIGLPGVLRLLEGRNRTAVFRAVIAYVDADGHAHTFLGECRGQIAPRPLGDHGFGYDPIFVPLEETRTFGQMPPQEKARYSHRGHALDLLVRHLGSANKKV